MPTVLSWGFWDELGFWRSNTYSESHDIFLCPTSEVPSLAILPPFAGGTPSQCTCLHVHIINAILIIQWDQLVGCKSLSFYPSGVVALFKEEEKGSHVGARRRIQWMDDGVALYLQPCQRSLQIRGLCKGGLQWVDWGCSKVLHPML
jgi:hypothetical protein